MKKRIMKSTLAVALVAAAAFGGMKTYGAYAGTAESEQILEENIEALSQQNETTWGYNPTVSPCPLGNPKKSKACGSIEQNGKEVNCMNSDC